MITEAVSKGLTTSEGNPIEHKDDDKPYSPTLSIKMNNDREVVAVFAKMKALVIEGGGTWFSTDAPGHLRKMGFNSKELYRPSRQIALRYIRNPACVVFAFNGHGNSTGLLINYSADSKVTSDPERWLSWRLSEPPFVSSEHPGYKLVYLGNCSGLAANGLAWHFVFKAQCVVGWDCFSPDTIGWSLFDQKFWELIEKGETAQEAVTKAYNEYSIILPNDSWVQCSGDVNLAHEVCYTDENSPSF